MKYFTDSELALYKYQYSFVVDEKSLHYASEYFYGISNSYNLHDGRNNMEYISYLFDSNFNKVMQFAINNINRLDQHNLPLLISLFKDLNRNYKNSLIIEAYINAIIADVIIEEEDGDDEDIAVVKLEHILDKSVKYKEIVVLTHPDTDEFCSSMIDLISKNADKIEAFIRKRYKENEGDKGVARYNRLLELKNYTNG